MGDPRRFNVPLYQVNPSLQRVPLQQARMVNWGNYRAPFCYQQVFHTGYSPFWQQGGFLYPTNNLQCVPFVNVPFPNCNGFLYNFNGNIAEISQNRTENFFKPTRNITIDYGVYRRIILATCDPEYQKVESKFIGRNRKKFNVEIIEKVENPNLLQKYGQRKQQYEGMYGHVEEKELFHGTKRSNLHEICLRNFNWRLGGTATGHLYGHGISFTPDPYYATHYGDKTEHGKVMILAKVLVSNQCVGNKNTKIPPRGYDTTTKEDGKVLVKYEDNSYYPAYIIYYSKF